MLQDGRVQAAGPVEAILIPKLLEPAFGVKIEHIARAGNGPCTSSGAALTHLRLEDQIRKLMTGRCLPHTHPPEDSRTPGKIAIAI